MNETLDEPEQFHPAAFVPAEFRLVRKSLVLHDHLRSVVANSLKFNSNQRVADAGRRIYPSPR